MDKADLDAHHRNFLLKRDRVHGVFYRQSDTEFDAWMLVCNKERQAFDRDALYAAHADTDFECLCAELRRRLGIRHI